MNQPDPVDTYWQLKLQRCAAALGRNNFNVFIAVDCTKARDIILDTIMPSLEVKTASWGDSMSFLATGVLDEIRNNPAIKLIETFAPGVPREQIIERRRQALLVDLFFTGSNAVTEEGQLVNLDMVGNRVAALTFGPKHVVLCIGRNKIASDLTAAMQRIRSYAAPINAIRHETLKTPCRTTASCHDCISPDRICNTWTITEKAFPKGRVNIILINEDLGL